jgi:hypothetical protein
MFAILGLGLCRIGADARDLGSPRKDEKFSEAESDSRHRLGRVEPAVPQNAGIHRLAAQWLYMLLESVFLHVQYMIYFGQKLGFLAFASISIY